MASIKVKFRPSTVSGRKGTVYFQITHARTVKLLFTRYFIFSEEWNSEKSMVMTMPDGSKRVDSLSAIRQKIRWDIEQLTRIIHQFEHDGLDYTAGDIIDEFKRYQNEGKLSNFMQKLIAEKNCRQQHRTAEIYKASLRRFKAFLFEVGEGNDILLYQIPPD